MCSQLRANVFFILNLPCLPTMSAIVWLCALKKARWSKLSPPTAPGLNTVKLEVLLGGFLGICSLKMSPHCITDHEIKQLGLVLWRLGETWEIKELDALGFQSPAVGSNTATKGRSYATKVRFISFLHWEEFAKELSIGRKIWMLGYNIDLMLFIHKDCIKILGLYLCCSNFLCFIFFRGCTGWD